jgi:hypothetical protein
MFSDLRQFEYAKVTLSLVYIIKGSVITVGILQR